MMDDGWMIVCFFGGLFEKEKDVIKYSFDKNIISINDK